MNIREDLKAYLDGELSAERVREIETALQSDPQLQKELEQMRFLGLEIRAVARDMQIEGKAQARELVTRPKKPWWHPLSGSGRLVWSAGCAVLLLMIVFPIVSSSMSSSNAEGASVASKSADYNDSIASGGAERSSANAPATSTAPTDGAVAPGTQDPSLRSPKREVALGDFNGVIGGSTGKNRRSVDDVKSEAGLSPSANSEIATNTRNQQTVPPSVEDQRMVVKNADIGLRVDSVVQAKTEVERIAKSNGGYIEGGQVTSYPNTTPAANLTLRVKSKMFEQAMGQLRLLGEVVLESQSGEDVTAQYADAEARIKVLKAEEDSYVTMLRGARRTGEILEIKDRLSQVRQEIESLDATKRALKNLSTLSTIRVSLEQKPKPGDKKKEESSDDAWANAVNGLMSVLRFLGNAVIYIFVYSPIWLPPVVLFWWLGKKAKKG